MIILYFSQHVSKQSYLVGILLVCKEVSLNFWWKEVVIFNMYKTNAFICKITYITDCNHIQLVYN